MISSPTEMTYASDLKEVINRVSKSYKRLGRATVEEHVGGAKGKRIDIILKGTDNQPILVIEVKRPEKNPLDLDVIKQAREYAKLIGAGLFATHNVNHVALFRLKDSQPVWQTTISSIHNLDEYLGIIDVIEAKWRDILGTVTGYVVNGTIPSPFGTDAVSMVISYVEACGNSPFLIAGLRRLVLNDSNARKLFDEWCEFEGVKPADDQAELLELVKVFASQYVNVLTNRTLFYNALRKYYQMQPLTLPETESFKEFLDAMNVFWESAKKFTGDFETIFDVGPMDQMPIPPESFGQLSFIASLLSSYDYSNLPADVIGRIFEALVSVGKRHLLGQFFTPVQVCDLIISMSTKISNGSTYLDPSSGSGSFLSRAYERMRSTDSGLSHKDLVKSIWGVDIAMFPSHLSTTNIALKAPDQSKVYPNVVRKDFFMIPSPQAPVSLGAKGQMTLDVGMPQKEAKAEIITQNKTIFDKKIPSFDNLVGNPPYTRFQELSNALFGPNYKENLESILNIDFPGASFGDTSAIYPYFVSHGLRFTKKGGSLGMVLLSQWLNTDYGEKFKAFILEKSKVKAIIVSPTERWFPDAQIIPLVILLQYDKPGLNKIRFATLKKGLLESFAPPASNADPLVKARYFDEIDILGTTILDAQYQEQINFEAFNAKGIFFENEILQIVEINQKEIDEDSNWDLFLRFPKEIVKNIFSHRAKFCSLAELGEIDYGIIANPIEYFDIDHTKNQFVKTNDKGIVILSSGGKGIAGIEKSALHPFISKTPDSYNEKEIHRLFSSKYNHTKAKHAKLPHATYLELGEQNIHNIRGRTDLVRISEYRAGSNDSGWADLGLGSKKKCQIFLPSIFYEVPRIFTTDTPCYHGHNVYGFVPGPEIRDKVSIEAMVAVLNSMPTLASLEFGGRQHLNRDGTRSIKMEQKDYQKLMIPDIRQFSASQLRQLDKLGAKLISIPAPPKFAEKMLKNNVIKAINKIVCEEFLELSEVNHSLVDNELISLVEIRGTPNTEK